MKEVLRLALACVVSAGTVLAIQGMRPPAAPRATVAAAPVAPDPELLARIDELERRLATPTPVSEPEAPPPPPAVDDTRIERLERAVAALEARPTATAREEDPRFRNFDDGQLRAHAAELSGLEAIDAWYTLLRRDLPPDERASALDAVANVHVKLKDYPSAVAAWGQALETEGVRGTQRAHGFMLSRGWALCYGGNQQAALQEMDRLLAEPGLTEAVESSARLNAGAWSYMIGDKDRARREYQGVIDRWAASPHEAFRKRVEIASNTMANLGLR